ncbi:MAG: pullulanase-type alpha,6-glucosidase, partial [Pseudomonadota bacterium]
MSLFSGLLKYLPASVVLCSSLLAGCSGGGSSTTGTPSTTPAASIPAKTLRMHFHRIQKDEAAWGAYAFEGPVKPSAEWIKDRFMFTQSDSFGGYVDIPIDTSKTAVKFLVTDGNGTKNCASDQAVTLASNIATTGQEIWMLEGSCVISDKVLPVTVANLSDAKAMWLDKTTLVWPAVPTTGSYKLYYAANGNISVDANGVFTGSDGSYALTIVPGGLSSALQGKFPHLKSATTLKLTDADAANARSRLKGQVVLAQLDVGGKLIQATSIQSAGVLDDVYAANAANARLGVTFDSNNVPTFRLWAPTAQSVKLNVYLDATSANKTTLDMVEDAASGVWSYTAANSAYTNVAYYTYSVNVISRFADNKLVSNEVTDPYSLSLNANSRRSFVANLASSDLKPAGWDSHSIPALAHPADI